ncbi:hypothetical protein [Paraburkholderia adhaesiva]|uniref:hypothetical protein n=1 Tax=Paraburkholderia adhaesiva TaxID=2883244 RepID=UPI001F3134FB|nr:hypothetical protein [Paraburkholderia adhaesiva]
MHAAEFGVNQANQAEMQRGADAVRGRGAEMRNSEAVRGRETEMRNSDAVRGREAGIRKSEAIRERGAEMRSHTEGDIQRGNAARERAGAVSGQLQGGQTGDFGTGIPSRR